MGCHQSGWLRFVLAGVLRDFDGRAGHKIKQAGDLAIGTALVEVPLAFAASRPAAVQARGAVCYASILFREYADAKLAAEACDRNGKRGASGSAVDLIAPSLPSAGILLPRSRPCFVIASYSFRRPKSRRRKPFVQMGGYFGLPGPADHFVPSCTECRSRGGPERMAA